MKNPQTELQFLGKFIHKALFCIKYILWLLNFHCILFSEKLSAFHNLGTTAAYINTDPDEINIVKPYFSDIAVKMETMD